jgi:TIGR03009 family protein
MDPMTRSVHVALTCCLPMLLITSAAVGHQLGPPQAYPQQQAYSQQAAPPANQQPTAVQPQPNSQAQPGAPVQPPAPQMPPGFPLNTLQQTAIDQVLDAWQAESGKVNTFSCPFDRLEYDAAFGPRINGQLAPLSKNKGELSYSKPDKGSFQVTKIYSYKEFPPPADQPQAPKRGDWVEQPNAIGEHWVCDGKSVYEFRSYTDPKQVVERPLPPRAPGESILDGPLPFLFGAESAKLKQRYWMKIDESQRNSPAPNPNQIWLTAWPKFQEQAANFRQVDVILDRTRLLPEAMSVTLPNGDWHVYVFNLQHASVNAPMDRIKQALFEKPSIPWGWKHVVEQVPVAQAPQEHAQQPPR